MDWTKATTLQRMRYCAEWALLVLAVSTVFLLCLPPGIMLAYTFLSLLSWIE